MKVGDSVMMVVDSTYPTQWQRIGLVLGYSRNMVLIFWGEDFPCEEEYREQLEVIDG
jgi:hypothetical protein